MIKKVNNKDYSKPTVTFGWETVQGKFSKTITDDVIKDLFEIDEDKSIDDSCISSDFENEEFFVAVKYKDESNNFRRFSFEATVLRHCCGVCELGNLSNVETFPQDKFNEYFKMLLRILKGKTLIINTNGKNNSVGWEKYLRSSKLFVPVKKFKNANGGNTVTIWVSNNE